MSQFYGASLPTTDYPLNSKGNCFSTVQQAVTDLAGDGWVYVPPGTWSEAVTISDDDVELFGAGWSSIIDGATTGHAVDVSGDRCKIHDLQVFTTGGGGNAYNAINLQGTFCTLLRVYIPDSDDNGVRTVGADMKIIGSKIMSCDGYGVYIGAPRAIIVGNYIEETMQTSGLGDDSIFMGNYVAWLLTLHADSENCVVDGNRLDSSITDNSGTSTVGDNDTT